MATKKQKSGNKKVTEPVVSAPDLEEKRQLFQQAVKHNKGVSKKNAPKHHTARKRTLIIAVGALLVMLGSALVAYSYFFWYQSPEKVVADALTNAMTARSVSFDAEINSPTRPLASIKGKYTDARAEATATVHTTLPGELQTLDVAAMTTDRAMYAKLSHATQVARAVAPQDQKHVIDTIAPALEKNVDDKWLRLQSQDMTLFQGITSLSSCATDAIRNTVTSSLAREAFLQTYLHKSFWTIKETRSDKRYGTYQLTIKKADFDAFLDDIVSTKGTTSFSNCTSEINAIKKSSIDASVIELIIDKQQRSINQIVVSTPGINAITVMATPSFDQKVTVSEPTDAVKFTEIKSLYLNALSTR